MRHKESELTLDEVPSGGNPYLTGNFGPVASEHDHVGPLPVTGALPPELDGMLLRNGPNPATVADPARYHWFVGDGMVHGISLHAGRAEYTNRWVRTKHLADEIGTADPKGPEEPINGPANTHVVSHAGRILALVESGLPHLLDPSLATLGVYDFDGMLASPMTAHPKIDPATGAMAFFGYDVFGPPFLRYHEVSADGVMVHSTDIALERPTMQHDFAVSERAVAFLDLPVVFDLDAAMERRPMPFTWDPGGMARVGLLPRGRPGSAIHWAEVEPGYVFHVMNAHDVDDRLVIDVCRYAKTFDTLPGQRIGSASARLERWTVAPDAERVHTQVLDDRSIEFPRVDPAMEGRRHRYGYCVELAASGQADLPMALVRYDFERSTTAVYGPGPGRFPSEPVFVRARGGRSDAEGWVLCVVYDAPSDTSDLVVLDASDFSTVQATVHLPVRVPFGFHGSWVSSAELER